MARLGLFSTSEIIVGFVAVPKWLPFLIDCRVRDIDVMQLSTKATTELRDKSY